MRRVLVVLGLAAGLIGRLAAFADAQQPPNSEHKVVFLCDSAQSVTVDFVGNAATLLVGESAVQLVQQPAASGIRYAGGGYELRGKGPQIVWTDPQGIAHNCRDQQWATTRPHEAVRTLAGTSWRLVHFQSSDDAIGTIVPPNIERYSLKFMADGTLAMQLDCNRGSARWKGQASSPRGGSLEISPGAMTRAMCAPGAIDTRLARDLSRVRSYTLADGRLSLALEADAGTYLWERVSEDGL